MTRWVSHHQNFIMIIYNLCQIKTPKLNFRIKWFAGIKLISKVSVYNFDLSALNETSDQWQILDPDVEDSHILPLGTLFKVSLCQSLSENSSYFRPSLNSKLILISKLILVLLGGLLKKQETEFGFQMQQILDVLEWLKTDVNIDKVRKHKLKIWASGTGSKRLYHITYMKCKCLKTSFKPSQSEKEIIFKLFTFADTDVFFLACEIHLCQDQYCSMPTRSQVHKIIRPVRHDYSNPFVYSRLTQSLVRATTSIRQRENVRRSSKDSKTPAVALKFQSKANYCVTDSNSESTRIKKFNWAENCRWWSLWKCQRWWLQNSTVSWANTATWDTWKRLCEANRNRYPRKSLK